MVSGTIMNQQDHYHVHFTTVEDATGHVMKFRALPAEDIVSIALEWMGEPPVAFTMVYNMLNFVKVDLEHDSPHAALEATRAALETRKPVKFGLPVLTPQQRKDAAYQARNARAEELSTGGATVAASSGSPN
jgi:hypothetical protein